MENINETINRLIEIINHNSLPVWVSYVGIFMPISISIAVAIISWFQNKKNNKLQKGIEESSERLQNTLTKHEEYIQMRNNILKIYDDFCLVSGLLARIRKSVHIIFSNYSIINGYSGSYQLIIDVNNIANAIYQATNRAKILFPREDKKIRSILDIIYQKYLILCQKINSYYYNGNGLSASENAWSVISSNNIPRHDYPTLMKNPLIYDNYLKLCDTNETKEIESLIEELLPLFEYDKFDKFFEPYLQMSSVEGKFNNISNK